MYIYKCMYISLDHDLSVAGQALGGVPHRDF